MAINMFNWFIKYGYMPFDFLSRRHYFSALFRHCGVALIIFISFYQLQRQLEIRSSIFINCASQNWFLKKWIVSNLSEFLEITPNGNRKHSTYGWFHNCCQQCNCSRLVWRVHYETCCSFTEKSKRQYSGYKKLIETEIWMFSIINRSTVPQTALHSLRPGDFDFLVAGALVHCEKNSPQTTLNPVNYLPVFKKSFSQIYQTA